MRSTRTWLGAERGGLHGESGARGGTRAYGTRLSLQVNVFSYYYNYQKETEIVIASGDTHAAGEFL